MDSSFDDRSFSNLCPKRTRTTISLEHKLNIIQRAEQGERASHLARTEHLPASTIRTILSKSDRIKRFGKVAAPQNAAHILRNTNTAMVEMEQKLTSWYELQLQQGATISLEHLKRKALDLYRDLAKGGAHAESFTASRGWFNRYRKRFNLLKCPPDTDSMQIESPVENNLVLSFKDIIRKNNYKPQQIFCVAETVLYWKRMPSKTFPSCLEKYPEDLKERFVLLMGGNAHGNFKLKPLLIYHLENPQALKGYPKGRLPVMWKTNSKLQLTQLNFSDWFTGYFCPTVEQLCRKNNLPNKALLVLDAEAGYPMNLDDLSNNVKVLYLPSDSIPLLQSKDAAVFKTFKAHYLHRSISQAVAATEREISDDLIEFWDTYNVKKAICNISDAWNDVKPSTMNSAWSKLYPDCIRNALEPESTRNISENIVDLAKELGTEDIDHNDVLELLEVQNEKLTESEINQLQKQRAREEFMDEDEHISPIRALTPSMLCEAMDNLEAAMAIYKECDPDSERSSIVCRNIENAVTCYRQLYRKKRKAITMDSLTDLNRNANEALTGESSSSRQSASSSELQTLNEYGIIFIKEET